jgi:hypothetical protein
MSRQQFEDAAKREKLIETFQVYENSVIQWDRTRVALGEDEDVDELLKTAKDLISEARTELIGAIIRTIEEEF